LADLDLPTFRELVTAARDRLRLLTGPRTNVRLRRLMHTQLVLKKKPGRPCREARA
jgi:hypothetical protein